MMEEGHKGGIRLLEYEGDLSGFHAFIILPFGLNLVKGVFL
jgi:hypothetical protein